MYCAAWDSWISIASHQSGRQLTLRRPDGPQPFLTMNFEGSDEVHNQNNVSLKFGYGISSLKKKTPLQIHVAPAALLYVPTDDTPRMHIMEGLLHIESSAASTRIDPETGRLLWSQFKATSHEESTSLRFETEPDNFDAVWKSWVEPRHFTAAGSTEKPVTSLVEYIMDECNHFDPAGSTARRAVMKLIGPELLAAADERYFAQKDENQGRFYIPWEKAGIAAEIACTVLKMEHQLLRPDSTAAAVAHGLMRCVLEENSENQNRLHQSVTQPDCGPVSCVIFGTLASWSNLKDTPHFGRIGFGRLTEQAFETDLQQWLDERQIVGRVAIQIVQRARMLTNEEVESLVKFSPNPELAQILGEILSDLRSERPNHDTRPGNHQDLNRICAGLTRLWTPVIRPLVEYQLMNLMKAESK